jgi:hypothetical protein
MSKDDEIKQAIGAVARLGGFTIKRVATTDDLKDRTLTITLTRVSDGWVQQRLDFEDEPALLATVDGNNGHVDAVEIVDPSDLTETDETQASADPDQVEQLTEGQAVVADPAEHVGAATGAPREGEEAALGETVELGGKKRR